MVSDANQSSEDGYFCLDGGPAEVRIANQLTTPAR